MADGSTGALSDGYYLGLESLILQMILQILLVIMVLILIYFIEIR